jgi:hypothetical protein
MSRTLSRLLRVLTLVAFWAAVIADRAAIAEPTREQALYWWQDEIRTVAFACNTARSGQVAQWPHMAVPAGQATLPVPRAAGPVTVDGQLQDDAWKNATRFPVGPIFDSWEQGPFRLEVAACRDEQSLYVAISVPRDLTDLGTLTADGHWLGIGQQTYRPGPDGGLPPGCVGRRNGDGYVLELAVPPAKELSLSFPVECLRRGPGPLPDAFAALGLDGLTAPADKRSHFRSPWLWLEPITVRLQPADVAVRLSWEGLDSKRPRLLASVLESDKPAALAEVPLTSSGDASVSHYAWKSTVGHGAWSAEGFCYVEPVSATLAQASLAKGESSVSQTLLAAAQAATPHDRSGWRRRYCRARELRAQAHLRLLDAPLLFVKQHPYFAGHIYDDFYTWHPGGGIYVLENPAAPPQEHRVRPVIDATTNETLGPGVYRDPDLSWDADRLAFACKPSRDDVTSIYTIGLDGRGLKRLTASDRHHDITPAWLPDDRLVFISTRPKALVPCFNSGVGTLHTVQADGSDLRSISANNVNEFDPSVLPDGRILYGRWEYVDKTALYMQSLWTVSPDGRMEEALYANNLARPTALLDARAVPGSQQVVASLTPHNGQAVGAIGRVDTARGKNDLAAVFNFTPEYPVEMDQGLAVGPCDPWPLSENELLISNNAIGAHGIIELLSHDGSRELVFCDREISCYSPMLVKARTRPAVVTPHVAPNAPGRFLLTDVYQGLTGIARGTITRLRVVEETARTSGIPPGGRWWNQAFLVSWQGAYIVKNVLGTVPVHEDGSAYFEAPPGRALYFEALDAEGREIQRMRTFVQAAPGVTRSCIGCHEQKKSAPPRPDHVSLALRQPPTQPQPESWGSGYIDYASMVQPVLDKYCVRCHGGPEGMGKGLDFSGGWTWAFNISYETFLKQRLTGFLNCNNGSVHTSQILPPRTIGSGAAPLADILIRKHPEVSRAERDLVLAWMDTNSNYYGSWDYTPHATCEVILNAGTSLSGAMQEAGCTPCHTPGYIGHDWINLQTPEWSRILRAPLPKEPGGLGLAMCRNRKARLGYPLIDQRVQPPDVFLASRQPEWDPGGEPHITIASTSVPHYQTMLEIIRRARVEALARPRVDMPGAEVIPGECRLQVPMPVPDTPPALAARLRPDTAVELSWPRTAATIGLQYEIHRGAAANFAPSAATQIGLTTAGRFVDLLPPVGPQHYALVVTSGDQRSKAVWASLIVPQPAPPEPARSLAAQPLPGEITLNWLGAELPGVRYDVYRSAAGAAELTKLTAEPLDRLTYADLDVEPGHSYVYAVRAVDRRGQQSPPTPTVAAVPLAEIKEPLFVADFSRGIEAARRDGSRVRGHAHAGAKAVEGTLALGTSGFVTFEHLPDFELRKAFSVECWVRLDQQSPMPVVAAAGTFNSHGWFLQRYGVGWRWHLAPVNCDGGQPVVGRWTYLAGTFDGRRACLYQDGKLVAQVAGVPARVPWTGPLVLGQYSSQGPAYQVQGALRGIRLYDRALRPAEIADHCAGDLSGQPRGP